NVKIASSSDRELSVAQLVQNFTALGSKDKAPDDNPLVGTVEFREQLWNRILTNLHQQNRFMTGFGFGPNLAAENGANVGTLKDPDLRNPHNSHLDVLARMGVFGGIMWLAIWGTWFVAVLDARTKQFRRGRPFEAGICGVVVVGVAASLCNA